MQVAIIVGSHSDKDKITPAINTLKKFNVDYECYVISAHRALNLLTSTIHELEEKNCQVIIAGAGLAAHLPGVIASHTIIPVVGVPVNVNLMGLDALLSIVQMPKDIPVATVGIDNASNGALLALQIIALNDKELSSKLKEFRKNLPADKNYQKVDW